MNMKCNRFIENILCGNGENEVTRKHIPECPECRKLESDFRMISDIKLESDCFKLPEIYDSVIRNEAAEFLAARKRHSHTFVKWFYITAAAASVIFVAGIIMHFSTPDKTVKTFAIEQSPIISRGATDQAQKILNLWDDGIDRELTQFGMELDYYSVNLGIQSQDNDNTSTDSSESFSIDIPDLLT